MRPAHAIAGAPPPLAPLRGAPPRAAAPAAGGVVDVEYSWQLRRNCSVTPRQFLLGLGGTAGIALLVSLYFTLRGLWPVAIYGAAEIALIAGAGWSFARHVRDGETVTLLADGRLIVEVQWGQATTRHIFNRNWARLVRLPGTDTLWLHHGAVRLRLARHVPPERRRRLETELRRTLPWRGPPTARQTARPALLHRRMP